MRKKWIFFLIIFLFGLGILFIYYERKDYVFKTDYYEAVNRETLSVNHLENGDYMWSRFVDAQEKSDDMVAKIIENIVSLDHNGLSNQMANNIRITYQKAMDMDFRNQTGMRDLDFYLNMVFESSSILELKDILIRIENELGIDLLANIVVESDYVDNEKNIVYFYPVTFAFGVNSDYIVNPDYMTYKAYLKRACVQLWEVYGYDVKEAREIVNRIFDFYEEVGNHSKLASDLEDISSYYQLISQDDFFRVYSNIDGKEYLKERGISNLESYSIVDLGQYQYVNDSFIESNLELWKEIIITKVLSCYAIYGSSEYVDIVIQLNQSLLGGTADDTVKEQALDIVKGLYSEEIDFVYEKEVLDYKQEKLLREMFLELKDYYAKMLENNDWLQQETINKALEKLDKMEVFIGLNGEDVNKDTSLFELSYDSSMIKDVIQIQQAKREYELSRLDSSKKRVEVSQSTVNAYYQPLSNAIVIPAAFVYLLDQEDHYYERLGSIGMILAHEITHGFDGNGSQFDLNGNLHLWWQEEDFEAFSKLQKKVIDYYSQYEVLKGKYINGEKTVNENIADLGALSCIVGIAREKGASNQEIRQMFTSFAEMWVSQESDAYMELVLLQDVHAPNKYRVNAVLSSMDDFYEVYGVHWWNDMSILQQNRIHVW